MSESADPSKWWARRGIRARSTIAAVAVVAVAFVVGVVGLVGVVRVTMTRSIEQSVSQRVRDAAAQIGSDDVDAVTAMAGATPGDATIVQVVAADGSVLVSSPSIQGEPAIVPPHSAGAGGVRIQELPLAFVDGDPYLVATTATRSAHGAVTVVAAQSLTPVGHITSILLVALAVVGPLLLAAVGAVTWLAVGRSLASVDRIRRRVDDIDAADLHERVPVPVAKDEVQRLAVTMNHMLGRLEHAMSRQREFVGDASHELKSPLATMRASLDVAQRAGAVSDDATQVLSEEVDRMTVLVADLLMLARADDGRPRLRVDVDVDDVVGEVVSALAGADPRVVIDVDARPARVAGDPVLLARAVRNLVDNAVRAARTQVRVEVGYAGDFVQVVVGDDGPGIAVQDRQRVFERFVRLDEHRARQAGGTGLGLAIVAEVANAHGGTVQIGDSGLGGAQFTLSLPTGAAVAQTGSSR